VLSNETVPPEVESKAYAAHFFFFLPNLNGRKQTCKKEGLRARTGN